MTFVPVPYRLWDDLGLAGCRSWAVLATFCDPDGCCPEEPVGLLEQVHPKRARRHRRAVALMIKHGELHMLADGGFQLPTLTELRPELEAIGWRPVPGGGWQE